MVSYFSMAWYSWLNPVKIIKEGYKEVVAPVVSPIIKVVSDGWNAAGNFLEGGVRTVLGSDAASLFNTAWTSVDPKVIGDYVERNIDRADKLSTALLNGNLSAIPAMALSSAVEMSMGTVQNANKMMAWTGVLSKTVSSVTGVDFKNLTDTMKNVLVDGVAEDLPDLVENGRVTDDAKRLLEKVLGLIPLGAQSGTVAEIEQKAILDRITFAFGVFFDVARNELSGKANGGIFCDLTGAWGFFGAFGVEQEEKLSAPSLTLSLQVYVINGPRDIFEECKVITVPVGGSVEAGPVFYKDSDKFVGMKYSYGRGPAVFNKKQEAASSSAQYLANESGNNIADTAGVLSGQALLWSAVVDTIPNPQAPKKKAILDPNLAYAAFNGSERAVFILSPQGKYFSLSEDGSRIEQLDTPNQNSIFMVMDTGLQPFSSSIPLNFNPITVNNMTLNLDSCRGTIIRAANNKYLYDDRVNSVNLNFQLTDLPSKLNAISNGFDTYLFHEVTTNELIARTFSSNSQLPLFDLLYFLPVERKEIGLRIVGTDDYLQACTLTIANKNRRTAFIGEDPFLLIKLGGAQVMLQNLQGSYLKLDGSRLTLSSKNETPSAAFVFTMDDRGDGVVSFKALTGNYYLSMTPNTIYPNNPAITPSTDYLYPGNVGIISLSSEAGSALKLYLIDMKGRSIGLRTYYADNALTAISTGAVVNYKPNCQRNPANVDCTTPTRLRYSAILQEQYYGLSLINIGKSAAGKDQFAFEYSLKNSEYRDAETFVLAGDFKASFFVPHPHNPDTTYASLGIGGMNNSFEIEQAGDVVYFKSSFSNHYLAIDPSFDDGSTHQLIFSENKYAWELTDLRGSFLGLNLAVHSRQNQLSNSIFGKFAYNFLQNTTVIAKRNGMLQWVSGRATDPENALQLIKIRDLDSAHLVALRAKDGTYVCYKPDGIGFSKELNTWNFFYLAKGENPYLVIAYLNKVIGVSGAHDNCLYGDGDAGFSIDATGDNYVLSLYDPLHVRLGDSSAQTAVLA
jgi:hypothetical protein